MTTPSRNIRVPDEVWFASQKEAVRRGETLTDAIVRYLERYSKTKSTKRTGYAAHTKNAVSHRQETNR